MLRLLEPSDEEEDQSKGMVISEESGNQNFGKSLKFDVPPYDGTTDMEYWIFMFQEFFEVYTIPKEHWINVSALNMEGSAYGWYMWSRRNKLFRDWSSFLAALRLRFRDSVYEDPKQALKELMQINTVEEYQSEFETLANKAIRLAKDWLISFFIGGLKEYIKSEVVLAKPTSYYETVSIVKLHEQRHEKVQQAVQPIFSKHIPVSGSKPLIVLPISTYHSPIKSLPTLNSTRNGTQNSGSADNSTPNPKALPYKRFTPAELKERCAKGLCYYYPEKYNRNHKYKPTFCVLIVEEDLEEFMHNDNEGEIHNLQGMEETEATIEWLATLGDIVTNHKDLTMSFQVGNKTVKLGGDSLLKSEPINAKGIKQMVEEKTLACLYSLHMVPKVAEKGQNSIRESLQLVEERFSEVFEEPKQLPPERWIDHRIELKPEAKPISIRPYSKKLSKKLSKASAYVRELYAITQAVMKWRHDLLGRRFTIKTDHKSLKELMHQVVQTPEQQFYLSKLLGFDFEIVYRTGRTNLLADGLSRQEDIDTVTEMEGSCHVITEVKSNIVAVVQKENKENEELQIIHGLFQKQQCSRLFTVKDGILLYDGRIFIPK
ncbi:Retrovirus-related Pol polyprotein [Senna tora]|uniref:Retrovirus-related Pol polyprotein n=1 Tax=Senna tora TaxID=362788 RepID=A0A835CME5_9FABA|nr:Retrovirus-related Pol polyprotein [Senna tora]